MEGSPMAGAEATGAHLSTTAVSAATGYSVQQIRDLESLSVIPPAPRSAWIHRSVWT